MAEFFKIVQIENSKRKRVTPKQKKVIKAKEVQVKQEAEKKVNIIRKKKKEAKRKEIPVEKPKPILKIGDRVRLHDGKAVGSIDMLEKGKATVNYGIFTTNVSIDALELVEAIKTK
jgi:DNA mismatch repair protein MutS2